MQAAHEGHDNAQLSRMPSHMKALDVSTICMEIPVK